MNDRTPYLSMLRFMYGLACCGAALSMLGIAGSAMIGWWGNALFHSVMLVTFGTLATYVLRDLREEVDD